MVKGQIEELKVGDCKEYNWDNIDITNLKISAPMELKQWNSNKYPTAYYYLPYERRQITKMLEGDFDNGVFHFFLYSQRGYGIQICHDLIFRWKRSKKNDLQYLNKLIVLTYCVTSDVQGIIIQSFLSYSRQLPDIGFGYMKRFINSCKYQYEYISLPYEYYAELYLNYANSSLSLLKNTSWPSKYHFEKESTGLLCRLYIDIVNHFLYYGYGYYSKIKNTSQKRDISTYDCERLMHNCEMVITGFFLNKDFSVDKWPNSGEKNICKKIIEILKTYNIKNNSIIERELKSTTSLWEKEFDPKELLCKSKNEYHRIVSDLAENYKYSKTLWSLYYKAGSAVAPYDKKIALEFYSMSCFLHKKINDLTKTNERILFHNDAVKQYFSEITKKYCDYDDITGYQKIISEFYASSMVLELQQQQQFSEIDEQNVAPKRENGSQHPIQKQKCVQNRLNEAREIVAMATKEVMAARNTTSAREILQGAVKDLIGLDRRNGIAFYLCASLLNHKLISMSKAESFFYFPEDSMEYALSSAFESLNGVSTNIQWLLHTSQSIAEEIISIINQHPSYVGTHAAIRDKEFATIEKKSGKVFYSIPRPEDVKPRFVINENKLEQFQQQTNEAQELLSSIFIDDEQEDRPSIVELPDTVSSILYVLLEKPVWKYSEVDDLCKKNGQMTGFVLEKINDYSYEIVDDAVIEQEDDEIYVTIDYKNQLI